MWKFRGRYMINTASTWIVYSFFLFFFFIHHISRSPHPSFLSATSLFNFLCPRVNSRKLRSGLEEEQVPSSAVRFSMGAVMTTTTRGKRISGSLRLVYFAHCTIREFFNIEGEGKDEEGRQSPECPSMYTLPSRFIGGERTFHS